MRKSKNILKNNRNLYFACNHNFKMSKNNFLLLIIYQTCDNEKKILYKIKYLLENKDKNLYINII